MKKLIENIKKYPIVFIFGILLLVMTVADFSSPVRNYSDTENRILSQKPSFSISKLLDKSNPYTSQYESYVNDQFFARDFWIDAKSRIETAIGKIENNGIVYGKDGHMFEKYTSFDTEQTQNNINYLNEFFAMIPDTKITFTIIPSSYQVLSDKMPYGLINVDQSKYISDIYSKISADNVNCFDMLSVLNGHKDENIYYRTDHHWTSYGAHIAYSALIDNWGLNGVSWDELAPLKKEEPEFYGTYYSKSKKLSAQPDTITYFDIPTTSVEIDSENADGLYDYSKFSERDKYAAFLHGNNGITRIKSDNNKNNTGDTPSKILVIKDSYANCFVPYLTYSFDEVVVVDPRSIRTMKDLLDNETFDEVLVMYNFMNFTSDNNIARLRW